MSQPADPVRTVSEQQGQPVPGAPSAHIGRYRVERLLGEGGFGRVYLAHDDQLQRPVAVKVPHARLVTQAGDAEAYLAEARTVARLDYPNIVPVHDVGSTDQFPCFIVSRYIDGSSLKARAQESRLSVEEAAGLVATVAEALHHAHRQGIVHRDVKPGNILLDQSGKPFVADFGLALREQDVGTGPRYAGTPAYMSPEQARGEGHRVDGRSDIFSLGVVLYELLTGRRPFQADARDELLEQIAGMEARPLRQWDDTISKELERICLKALAKRAAERYATARDLADDLRHFLAAASAEERSAVTGQERREADAATPTASPAPTPSALQAVKIVPKGLRSFDAGDADFFLELLPGPRDRDGLPESIRFWKGRIEATDTDATFSVGLLYGPSGCGKSSLVKAGLLPRLARHATAVYVEATAGETEAQLLKGLRRQVAELPGNLGLVESLAALRQGRFLEPGRKLLLVLDQFEQWLHARPAEESTELVQALRQCDGGRVQALVLVRDDFWLAVSRFMGALEAELVQGRNLALVDLFDLRHARKVLAAFGRAFGALPERADALGREQAAFLEQAVAGLSQEGKVVPVRLAVFAEMVKGRAWTPAALKEVGGTEGVGVTFLEETFSSPGANPRHRLHQKAARAVLKALLPEAGTDIRGHMRSHAELLAASGYAGRPKEFGDLLRILDGEVRLITPTDPEGVPGEPGALAPGGPLPSPVADAPGSPARYYQLTHDYLVPSLREWLTRKQRETWRGRAELRLAERATLWHSKPENRHLPAWWEWANIRLLTRRKDWTAPQRQMMRKAGRYHGVRGLALALLLAAAAFVGLSLYRRVVEEKSANHAADLVAHLADAEVGQVPDIVAALGPYRPWADPRLRDTLQDPTASPKRRLHASLALLPVDLGQVSYLHDRLLEPEAPPAEVLVIRKALEPYGEQLGDDLWQLAADRGADSARRFRAACALARFDPDSPRWEQAAPDVAGWLVAQNTAFLGQWMEGLQPVSPRLLPALDKLFHQGEPPQWATAADVLAAYAADQPEVLGGLLLDADARQWTALWPKLPAHRERAIALMQRKLQQEMPPEDQVEARDRLAKQQAQAAVALLRFGQEDAVWPLLRHSPDPSRRTYLLHRLGPLGADPRVLIHRLEEEADPSSRRALILALGEFTEEQLPAAARQPLTATLLAWYRDDPDPGTHAAIDWLLRHDTEGDVPRKLDWGQGEALARLDGALALLRDKAQLGGVLAAAPAGPLPLLPVLHLGPQEGGRATQAPEARRGWYVNGQGQTMVVVPGPVEFRMGSPPSQRDRFADEGQHLRKIPRSYALATKPVTVAEFQRFLEANPKAKKQFDAGGQAAELLKRYSPAADGPIIWVDWYTAVAYCNWLSQQEGIPEAEWVYPKGPGAIRAGMTMPAGYLGRTGYRLPTEAEWEYACRAEAETSRYYGAAEELLPRYAWYMQNSHERAWPVGQKKPNDFGLFDMHGNVWVWCQDRYGPYPEAAAGQPVDDADDKDNKDVERRLLRGGSFGHVAVIVRSAYRNGLAPANRLISVGFRPARTYR